MNMIIIPLVTLLVMTAVILILRKYMAFTTWVFKLLVILCYLLNFFFLYWGPHIAKGQSGFVEFSDMWYIIVVAVLSLIIPLGKLTKIKSDKEQGL